MKIFFKVALINLMWLNFSCNNELNTLIEQRFECPENLYVSDYPDEKAILITNQHDLLELVGENFSELDKINLKKYNFIYIQGKSTTSIIDLESNISIIEDKIYITIDIDNNSYCQEIKTWNVSYLISKDTSKSIYVTVKYSRNS